MVCLEEMRVEEVLYDLLYALNMLIISVPFLLFGWKDMATRLKMLSMLLSWLFPCARHEVCSGHLIVMP